MRSLLSLFALSMALAPIVAFAEENEFVPLFDGVSVDSWTKKGGEATYEIEEHVLVGTTKPNTPNTFLCPPKQYGDFELKFETKCDAALNSGVQIRSIDSLEMIPDALEGDALKKVQNRGKVGSLAGPQVEIAANGNAGGVWFEGAGGWGPEPNPELAKEIYKPNEWNSYHVIVQGETVSVSINGTQISQGSIARTHMTKGWLGFQVHGVGKREDPLQVRWRNIQIREL